MYVKHPLVKDNTVKLREYQEAIISSAINANTLVVLPTGLGKTMIAAMVAAHRLEKFPDSKVLFLAPTKPLVVQHKKTFSELLNVEELAVLTGTDSILNRPKTFEKNRIIFATPQTIENDLMRGLTLKNVSLIIFDEAHRAVGDYSYVYIASEYIKQSANSLILGLTASPSSDSEKIKELCGSLFIKQIEAKTEKDSDVKPYVQETRTDWVRVELPPEFKKVKTELENVLRDDLNLLKDFHYLDSSNLRKINKRRILEIQHEIRKDITSGADSFAAASVAASALKIFHAIELLETQGISALNEYFKRLKEQRSKAVKKLLNDKRLQEIIRIVHDLKVLGIDHPKLDELVKIVRTYKNKKVLIFTQYRDSVDKIIEKLNCADILAHEFIGQAQKGTKKGMSQKEQVKVLENFREGKYTALVATSVAEEGLDIPRVDLVVFYEPVPSEIRAIQRRGRTGRTAAGRVVILMANDTRDESYFWASFHKEKKMGSLIRGMKHGFETDIGQQTLVKYAPKQENYTVRIYVDVREQASGVMKLLREKANLELKQLEVGDYLLSDRVVVERKNVDDFLQSIVDGRLLTQAAELVRNFEIPIIILENGEDIYSIRNIHPNAVRGALAALAVDFGISVIPSNSEEDTAEILYTIAKREQLDEQRTIRLHGEKKPMTLTEKQLFVVESLPNVSGVLARRLLEQFGSVQNLANASEKELTKVEGIGEKKAEEIRKVLKGRYKLE